MSKIWRKKWVKWTIIIVVVIALGRLAFGGSKVVEYETARVSRAAVTETVAATGQVKSKEYASLRFKIAGTISRMNVDTGAVVGAGQTLASLDTSELNKKVIQAEAQAAGAQVALTNAGQAVEDAKTKGDQALSVLYTNAPNKFNDILNLTEQAYATFATFYDSSDHLSGSLRSAILNSQRITDADNAKAVGDGAIAKIKASLESFPIGASTLQIDAALIAIDQPLQRLQSSLNSVINAIASIPTGSVSATTLDEYKTALSTAQGNMNSAISTEVTLTSNLHDAKVQNTLNLNTAKSSERSAEAELAKANAALSIAQQNLADAHLRAPIGGTIASKDKQIGESVTIGDQVYYLLGAGGLEIVANIPEVDIAKVSVGDTAKIGLDAYEDDVIFPARVAAIDPAETIVDGIATYKVTFAFESAQAKVRSGMTANISIETDLHENVIAIPQRALTTKDGIKTVRVAGAAGTEPSEVEVKTGLRGGDGTIEITEGLAEGAVIITGTK